MRWLLSLLAIVGSITTADAQRPQARPFPHEKHERLFPLCESCHAGIASGESSAAMPAESSCLSCHNGTDERRVTWSRPVRVVGLLRFSHPTHGHEVDSTGKACATCHVPAGSRMSVQRAQPSTCLGCHTHRASAHLAEDNRCAVCHVPLTAATGLTTERIAGLPKPPSHERADFGVTHAPSTDLASASCATCHARESCARCHVNASTQTLISTLGTDPRVATLVAAKAAAWPKPKDHAADGFDRTHGVLARQNTNRCGACHARPACTSCHTGTGAADVLFRMPSPAPGGATGVRLQLQRLPARLNPPNLLLGTDTTPRLVKVHNGDFRKAHGSMAASQALTCAGCHERKFCADCHATEIPRRFHPANFQERHAADSYGRETDCASCHNAELFCRSCHAQSGLASKGRLDAAYHTAQPQWLLQHGRAARQGLQSCSTCHAQRDCMTCHSTLGWGVSPHGPGFNAERLASKQATQCLMCHLKVPGRR